MELNHLLFDIDGRIATITLNRPKALNALNKALLAELDHLVSRLETSREADALILTGAGEKSFVAGADIAEMKDMTPEEALAFAQQGQRVFSRLEALPIPVIAAVNGFALGGGCELAMACDLILAAEGARFGQPEVNLGVIPGFGGTQRLTRRVGLQWARFLIYSAEMLKAPDAARIGLVLKVVPAADLLAEAKAMATLMASKGTVAIALSKAAIQKGMDGSLQQGLDIEAEAFARCFTTEDQKEGMDAFLSRRPPSFSGR